MLSANDILISKHILNRAPSHTTDDFCVGQEDVGDDLYEFLTQWFTIFEEFKGNDFFAFGESYAGKSMEAYSNFE